MNELEDKPDNRLWTHILKRIHPEVTSFLDSPAEAHTAKLAFALLVNAEDLRSDGEVVNPTYTEAATNFVDREDYVETIRKKITSGDRMCLSEWLFLSYSASVFELLKREWDEFYGTSFLSQNTQKITLSVLDILERISYEDALHNLEKQWASVPADDSKTDIAALLYVRACAVMGIYADPPFYEKVAKLLSFDNSFLVVYISAACLKLDGISRRVDISSWTSSQYACLMMTDTFYFLPGTAWG